MIIMFFSSLCVFRVIFNAKDGEFVDLTRGGENAVFVKSKEDKQSRKEKLWVKDSETFSTLNKIFKCLPKCKK